MEEKILIRSDTNYIQAWRQTSLKFLIGGAIAFVLGFIIPPLMYLGIVALVIGAPLFLFTALIRRTSLTVTDRRVYGPAAFGQRVDLPLDSVSAVGMSMFKGIAVGTSSGKIKFLGISNREAIHKTISDLLIQRQKEKHSPQVQASAPSSADELGKYKKLLDDGAISQEEFDAKKKQILGL